LALKSPNKIFIWYITHLKVFLVNRINYKFESIFLNIFIHLLGFRNGMGAPHL
jgi:hypothetical protein